MEALKTLASENNAGAQFVLAEVYMCLGQNDAGIKLYLELSDNGHGQASYTLGQFSESGVLANIPRAVEHYIKAFQQGYEEEALRALKHLIHTEKTKKETLASLSSQCSSTNQKQIIFNVFEKLAEQGSVVALRVLDNLAKSGNKEAGKAKDILACIERNTDVASIKLPLEDLDRVMEAVRTLVESLRGQSSSSDGV